MKKNKKFVTLRVLLPESDSRFSEGLCKFLMNVPENRREWCFDPNSYQCSITGNECIGRDSTEISLQPSHYSPETVYSYDQKTAERKCPMNVLLRKLDE